MYVEAFWGMDGKLRWRALDPATGREVVADTREEAEARLRELLGPWNPPAAPVNERQFSTK